MSEETKSIEELPVVVKMAEDYHLTGRALVHTVRTVAVDGTISNTELLSCLMVAKEHGLNPLTREIYFIKGKAKKDKKTNKWIEGLVQPIVSVDGWIKKCNTHNQFNGLEFTDLHDDKGNLRAITCKIWRKDREHPTTITEYMDECRPEDVSFGPWKSHPSRMLRHRALIQCARIAFGFAGIMDPDEFGVWQDSIKDVTPETPAEPDFPDIDAEMSGPEPKEEKEDLAVIQLYQVGDASLTEHEVIEQIQSELAVASEEEVCQEVLEAWEDTINELPKKGRLFVQDAYEERKAAIIRGEEAA